MDFKYLGTNKNIKNHMHNEKELRIIAANKRYFALEKLIKSKLLSMTFNEIQINTILELSRLVLSYGCEMWSVAKG